MADEEVTGAGEDPTVEQLKRERLAAEFETIRGMSETGLLDPKAAVAWARNNPESELHSRLDWDDTRAAEKYRVDQVRYLVKTVVTHLPRENRVVHAYVSAPSDRVCGGGYRKVEDALAGARLELVNEALVEIGRMRNRYTHLPELDPLFVGIERLLAKFRADSASREAG